MFQIPVSQGSPWQSPSRSNIAVEATETEHISSSPEFSPEKKLLVAILRRAVFDFALYRDSTDENHELAVEAAEWLWSESEEHMSFRYICDILDMEPGVMRKKALALGRNDIKKISQYAGTDD